MTPVLCTGLVLVGTNLTRCWPVPEPWQIKTEQTPIPEYVGN